MTDRELMQQALEALEAYRPVIVKRYGLTYSVGDKAITVLRERLAQPDPVPYWHSEFLKHNTTSGQPAQEQEPVATMDSLEQEIYERTREFVSLNVMEWLLNRLNTSPPAQRKPLTDEEILHRVDTHVGGPSPSYPLDNSDWLNFARAIEAAHGIIGEQK